MIQDTYSEHGIDLKTLKVTGEVSCICPECSHKRKKKNDKCLSVNLDKKVWFCPHCGWAGALRKEKDEVMVYQKPKWSNKTKLSDKVVAWFEKRKISQRTLLEMKITEGLEWMPQTQKEENTIRFNYFKDGELINIKYRDGAKRFKLHKGAELIFYNYDCIEQSSELFVVEGELDVLAMIESGYPNTISVPNGASLNNNNLSYLDECVEAFNGKSIHLAFDNDTAGRKLREDFADRIGKERCDYIEFKDCKDANDCLIKYGSQGIIESVKPIQFPLEGSFTISDIDNEIEDMYVNGLDRGVSTYIPDFNLNIVKGYITVVTGIPSHGKSEWVDYMTLKLRLHHNWKGAFYSPENKPTQLHFSKMARRLIGKNWDGDFRLSDGEKNLVKKFLDGFIWFIKPEKDFTLSSILAKIATLKNRFGLDYFVIDAWNKLEHKGESTDYIGRCLDEIAVFCETHNVHCFLVAHPTKIKKQRDSTEYEIPTLYDVAGSANFYNKADNGICVFRDFNLNKAFIYRQKMKFDHWGAEGQSEYTYNSDSKRYIHNYVPDNSNWIANVLKAEQSEFSDMLELSEKSESIGVIRNINTNTPEGWTTPPF